VKSASTVPATGSPATIRAAQQQVAPEDIPFYRAWLAAGPQVGAPCPLLLLLRPLLLAVLHAAQHGSTKASLSPLSTPAPPSPGSN
jgi:hypothetical protein